MRRFFDFQQLGPLFLYTHHTVVKARNNIKSRIFCQFILHCSFNFGRCCGVFFKRADNCQCYLLSFLAYLGYFYAFLSDLIQLMKMFVWPERPFSWLACTRQRRIEFQEIKDKISSRYNVFNFSLCCYCYYLNRPFKISRVSFEDLLFGHFGSRLSRNKRRLLSTCADSDHSIFSVFP